jgi:hypothetical protein
VLLILAGCANRVAADDAAARPWRAIPLVKDGKVSDEWAQVGWGRFVVDGDGLRAEPDERGMGLLVYKRQRLGDCQIRIVYKPERTNCNSGVYVRLDDGILERAGKESLALRREPNGKLSKEMIQKLQAAAEAEEGVWYAVHHGYEVQIMDEADALHRTGAVYGLSKADALPKANADGWRTMVITLRGNVVEVEVDGKRVNRFDSEAADKDAPAKRQWTEPKRDAKRPQVGYIGLQAHDPGDVVRFKEVSVRPLDDVKP